ncbi:MAG: holo-[acyl-carrier-protein] synthase [Planctomycetes bacterium]|nr:holo-[acyl-carrier-protein] synthase [Planctomycetota bacterium]
MKILGISSEIVECLRVARMIERHEEAFLNRVYTPREARWCRGRRNVTEHFAGHWAAKQAVLKCLAGNKRKGLVLTEIEIRLDRTRVPKVYLGGAARERAVSLRIADMMLTIAHCRAFATAMVIVLGREPNRSPK